MSFSCDFVGGFVMFNLVRFIVEYILGVFSLFRCNVVFSFIIVRGLVFV